MSPGWIGALAIVAAAALDRAVGEPSAPCHPVRWLGRCLAALERRAPRSPAGAFAYGLAAELALGAALAAAAWAAERLVLARLPGWLATAALAVALKPSFAVRALLEAGREVEAALRAGDLPTARRALAAHLVSRDTSSLTAGQAAGAAVESLAENTADSVVAPLFYFVLFGLPGAWCYRLVNTADAMWGYRLPRYAWLGQGPARLDDAAGWLPARLSALLLLAAGWLGGVRPGPRAGWRAWRRDAHLTASPNAGHPMAAAAGLLGVRLEKVGAYVLHGEGREPQAADVARARRLVGSAALLAVGAGALAAALV